MHNGVSLQLLRDLSEECNIDDRTTAADVCARHVKPITADACTAMVTVLQHGRDGQGVPWCGAPTAFISYAWSYSFRKLIDIVEHFEEERR